MFALAGEGAGARDARRRGVRGGALRGGVEALRASVSFRRAPFGRKEEPNLTSLQKKRAPPRSLLARAGAARRAAGHGEAAERLVRDAIDTLESLEFRRETRARAGPLCFRATRALDRTRKRQEPDAKRRANHDGNVSRGVAVLDRLLVRFRRGGRRARAGAPGAFEITGATADAARAVRAAEACEETPRRRSSCGGRTGTRARRNIRAREERVARRALAVANSGSTRDAKRSFLFQAFLFLGA